MPFSRSPTNIYGNHKLAGLDHLRALAIVLVMLYHYRLFGHPEWLDGFGKFGWTGVDLFFVLSGYLISSQLFAKMAEGRKIIFKVFFIRRFFRIIPAYLTVVAIYFLVPAFREREALPPLWKFLAFTQNFGLDLDKHGTFSHAWSLCIEEQFYLLLPLVLIALVYLKAQKRGVFLLLCLFAFGFAARIYCWEHFVSPLVASGNYGLVWYEWVYYPTWGRLDGLLMGISIAALFQFRLTVAERIAQYGNVLVVVSIVVLVGAYYLCADEQSFYASVFGFAVVAVGYGLLVFAAISPTCFLYKIRSGITTKIATLSFGIYLVHKGVIHITQSLLVKCGIAVDGNMMFVLCIVSSFAGALLLNIIVEQPFLRLRKKILG